MAIEATRASYVAAFEALLGGRTPRVSATATLPVSDATNTQTMSLAARW